MLLVIRIIILGPKSGANGLDLTMITIIIINSPHPCQHPSKEWLAITMIVIVISNVIIFIVIIIVIAVLIIILHVTIIILAPRPCQHPGKE